MTRTFQEKTSVGTVILLVVLLAVTVYFMWIVNGILIALSLVLMLLVVERIIHSQYVVDHDSLMVYHGRFSQNKVIPIDSIQRIERINRIRIGNRTLQSYLLIVYGDEKSVAVNPKNEDEFIQTIMKIRYEK